MPNKYLDIAPADNAYTPAMLKLKQIMEGMLGRANDPEYSAELFKKSFMARTEEITRVMSMVLSQDILYKAGVKYNPRSERSV
jgi:hypothetical protein